MKRSGQFHNALNDAQIVRIGQHVAHKALVNFQRVHRQLAQVGERRVTCAKVIQGEAHAQVLAALNDVDGLLHVANGGRFQNLQIQR